MRRDIKDVLTERERIGSSFSSQKTALSIDPAVSTWDDIDCGPVYLSSSRHRQGGCWHKTLNENINPLRRYLQANVGRPWNDIYSEVRACIDPRSDAGWYALQHLKWIVETQVEVIDGEVYPTRGHYLYRKFYIHPESGILCSTTPFKKKKRQIPITVVKINGDADYYEKVNGIWYHFLMEFPPQEYRVVSYEESTAAERILYDLKVSGDTCAVPRQLLSPTLISKKQASKREIRWIKDQIKHKKETYGYTSNWGSPRLIRIDTE